MKLIGLQGKQDFSARETDKQQDAMLAAFIDNIADLDVKTCLEEKLRELDSKNDTIHVCNFCIVTVSLYWQVKINY